MSEPARHRSVSLTAAAAFVLGAALLPSPVRGEAGVSRDAGSATPDFDADGFADLAIGAPYSNRGAVAGGAVHVLYGSSAGLVPDRRQLWTQDSAGIADHVERGDQLGWSIATGDFDADGYDDLATSARWESRPGAWHSGAVHVLHGSADGLSAERDQVWTQDSRGVGERAEPEDQFGSVLVAGDFDGDGYGDLAVGVPMEDRDGTDAGVVHVLYGSADGLSARRSQIWTQDTPGIADRAEPWDHFGGALAAGDLDGDGRDELAIGVPYEGRRVPRQGIVHVLPGTARGLSARKAQIWHQDVPGIADRSELRDQFGQSLAIGDFDGDGYGDLVVGAWWEDHRSDLSDEGAFHVIHGSRHGLDAKRSQYWHQDRRGTKDRRHDSDNFGQVLGPADFDGDGRDDLAVGIPSADLGTDVLANRGAVHVFLGSSAGLTTRGDRYLTQDSPGIADRAERYDRFGTSVAGADFDGDGRDDLAIGVAWEDGARQDEGMVHVLPGSRRGPDTDQDMILGPAGTDLAPREWRASLFGWSLSGSGSASGSARTNDPRN